MKEIKEKITGIDTEELEIKSVNVNRKFVSVKYSSDLENDDIKSLLKNELSSEELFGINFSTDSSPDTQEEVKVVKFRLK